MKALVVVAALTSVAHAGVTFPNLSQPRAPLGCPQPANYDPDDTRGDLVATPSPGLVTVVFSSHKEAGIMWTLYWADGWVDIGEYTF